MLSRRVFVKNGALALVSLGFAPAFLSRAAAAAAGRGKVMIAVFQRGAVDGLNMIVPFGDPSYYAARPTIAIPRPERGSSGTALDLDGFFGLHPRLAPLAPLFHAGQLAIVHACGSPHATRSHFDAQDYMESATPGVKSTPDGWMNRVLGAAQGPQTTPFRAVSLTPHLPRTLQGPAPALALGRIGDFGIRAGRATDRVRASLESAYAAAPDQALNATGREAFDAIRLLQRADPARYQPAPHVEYPRSPLGEALAQIAQLVKADVGLELAFAESTNWDHHVNEGSVDGQIATRLDDLGRGLSALAADLGDRLRDVVIVTMSEFGRTVAENGNRGTDHGHGNAMMILGGSVRGGRVFGRWPGLERDRLFEQRDLAITTDFRDVFGEIAVRHLGVRSPQAVFPGYAIDAGRFCGFLG
jgi:uncharacterized protein (DUF1501 family)